jgi:Apea-like HEPN
MAKGNKAADSIKGDKDLKKLCAEFCDLALSKVWDRQSPLRKNGPMPFIRNNTIFQADENLFREASSLVARCVKKLGVKYDDDAEVETSMWKHVSGGSERGISAAAIAEEFIGSLAEHAKGEYYYVAANQLFRFSSSAGRIQIGPVEIIKVSNPAHDIFDGKFNPDWTLKVGLEYAFSAKAGIEIQIPSTCWKIFVQASHCNAKEESEWVMDVTTSLLRLTQENLLIQASHGRFPRVGDVEPMPCIIAESETRHLLMTDDGISTGGMWVPPLYVIDDALIAATQTADFKAKAEAIFSPSEKCLAERVGQGLGWLSRGRQSEDRAERFLFFFTAIEALLSNDDKTAPVVQNIARGAAVILTNDVNKRVEHASRIKSLYGTRSALVHSGRRGVIQQSADFVQNIAETLYAKVLQNIPLTERFDTFQTALARATYGLPWPEHSNKGGVNNAPAAIVAVAAPAQSTPPAVPPVPEVAAASPPALPEADARVVPVPAPSDREQP